MNFHDKEPKACWKSFETSKPGIFCCLDSNRMSYIRRIFSPMNRPELKPFWSLLIILSKTDFRRFAITVDIIL